MKLTLEIPDAHRTFFLELLQSLNFEVKVQDSEEIPEWHKQILDKRLSVYKQADKSAFVSWSDLQHKLLMTT